MGHTCWVAVSLQGPEWEDEVFIHFKSLSSLIFSESVYLSRNIVEYAIFDDDTVSKLVSLLSGIVEINNEMVVSEVAEAIFKECLKDFENFQKIQKFVYDVIGGAKNLSFFESNEVDDPDYHDVSLTFDEVIDELRITTATIKNDPETVQNLFKIQKSVPTHLMSYAVRLSDTKIMKFLLSKGARPGHY